METEEGVSQTVGGRGWREGIGKVLKRMGWRSGDVGGGVWV